MAQNCSGLRLCCSWGEPGEDGDEGSENEDDVDDREEVDDTEDTRLRCFSEGLAKFRRLGVAMLLLV